MVTMGLSRTVSEIIGDLSRKAQNFGFLSELGVGARSQKTRMVGLPDGQKSFKTDLAVYSQYCPSYNV